MRNPQNPTDNTGYMPLKRHIALTVVRKAEYQDSEEDVELINTILKPAPKNVIGAYRIAPSPWRAGEKNEFIKRNSHGK
jgi:hypothetical protein